MDPRIVTIPKAMSRTMFCKKCAEAERPEKLTIYVVFGGTSREVKALLHAGVVPKENLGFTPHLITTKTIERDGDVIKILLQISCGIIGCGYKYRLEKGDLLFTPEEVHYQVIDLNAFINLINFKDRSYYLTSTIDHNWDMQEIAEEQSSKASRLKSRECRK